MQITGGADGPFRIIGMGHRRAENGHHRIADMFIDGAAIAQRGGIRHREKRVQHLVGRLAPQPFRQCGEAGNIGE